MNTRPRFLIALSMIGWLLATDSLRHADAGQLNSEIQLVNLRCEYRVDPIGIDILTPR